MSLLGMSLVTASPAPLSRSSYTLLPLPLYISHPTILPPLIPLFLPLSLSPSSLFISLVCGHAPIVFVPSTFCSATADRRGFPLYFPAPLVEIAHQTSPRCHWTVKRSDGIGKSTCRFNSSSRIDSIISPPPQRSLRMQNRATGLEHLRETLDSSTNGRNSSKDRQSTRLDSSTNTKDPSTNRRETLDSEGLARGFCSTFRLRWWEPSRTGQELTGIESIRR
jgi:hypothetical protein